MELTTLQVQELRIAFNAWRVLELSESRPYPPKDEATFRALAPRAAQYGALGGARSSWTRAAIELAKEGVIKLRQPAPQPPEIDQAFRDEVQRMHSTDLRNRLNTDFTFKAKFDVLAAEDTAERPREENYSNFTAANWRSLPASTIAKLMNKPAFRKRIDELIAAGQI